MTVFQPARYIDTQDALQHLVQTLSQESIIAIDTESNSLYAYREQVCLIQISTRTADFIVDTVTLDDISPLYDIFTRPDIEKVFHAAEYDIICLKRDYGITVRNLFDTMYAVHLLGEKKLGLNDLIQAHFGVKLDKSHQLDDWGKRPLAQESLHYAQMDTHYLITLRDYCMEHLQALNSLAEAREVFDDVTRSEPREIEFDPEGYWRIVRPNQLSKKEMAVLSELYIWREKIAEAENYPPYKVVDNRLLIALAKEAPTTWRQLQEIKGINFRQLRMYSDDLIKAIEIGRKKKPPTPPSPQTQEQRVADRYIALHAWRKERAIKRGVESNIILSKSTLWDIAYRHPKTLESLAQITGMGAWRLETYGAELLDLLKTLR